MLRIVKRLMALSLGVQRLQLEQRMGFTWPRPFLLRPLFGSSAWRDWYFEQGRLLGRALLHHSGVPDEGLESRAGWSMGRRKGRLELAKWWRRKTFQVESKFECKCAPPPPPLPPQHLINLILSAARLTPRKQTKRAANHRPHSLHSTSTTAPQPEPRAPCKNSFQAAPNH